MKKSVFGVALFVLGLAMNVMAADAGTLAVTEKVELNAPASVVWAKVNNFGDLGAWHPAVANTEITAGSNNEKGAVRVLTLQDGGKITEKLRAYNGKNMSYRYEIVEGVLPVSSYVSTISVAPAGAEKSVVTWKGNFKRKDTSKNPASGQDDAAAVNTITSVYRGGLDNLKKLVEAE